MEATLRFELRLDTINKMGEHPLILIIRIAGQRRKVSTGITLFPELWDNQHQQIVNLTTKLRTQLARQYGDKLPTKSQMVQYQDQMSALISEVRTIESRFSFEKTPYSADMVAEVIKQKQKKATKKEDPSTLVYDFIDQYIEEHKNIREKGSLTVYKSLKKHLTNYQNHTRSKVRFDQIDYNFLQGFQSFLVNWEETHEKTKRVISLNNTTISKQLRTLKTFLSYAKKKGIAINPGHKDFSVREYKMEVIALTQEELEHLLALDLQANKRLDQVRDVFCFSCVSGFRYSDLEQMHRGHIKDDEIRITVKKTKRPLIVPLNRFSKAILEKYRDLEAPLPVISNQKFNKYIKELCKLAGINDPIEIIRYKGSQKQSTVYRKYEVISAHTGRKTFATLSLEKGIPAETVMKITGHADYKSFQRYVKVTEERKRNEMQKAWGAPS